MRVLPRGGGGGDGGRGGAGRPCRPPACSGAPALHPHLLEEDADVLRAEGDLDAHQLLDGERVRVLLRHHRDVVEAVKVGQRLGAARGGRGGAGAGRRDSGTEERLVDALCLVLDQLFRAAVEEPNVRVGLEDHLAVELENQAEHAVRGGVLGAEVLPRDTRMTLRVASLRSSAGAHSPS